jgi:hypothetical protein
VTRLKPVRAAIESVFTCSHRLSVAEVIRLNLDVHKTWYQDTIGRLYYTVKI